MGNYLSFYNNDNSVYTLQDEEKERTIIDNEMDMEINTKNFWYWGLLDKYLLEKELGQKILTPEEELLCCNNINNGLQNNELPQAEC